MIQCNIKWVNDTGTWFWNLNRIYWGCRRNSVTSVVLGSLQRLGLSWGSLRCLNLSWGTLRRLDLSWGALGGSTSPWEHCSNVVIMFLILGPRCRRLLLLLPPRRRDGEVKKHGGCLQREKSSTPSLSSILGCTFLPSARHTSYNSSSLLINLILKNKGCTLIRYQLDSWFETHPIAGELKRSTEILFAMQTFLRMKKKNGYMGPTLQGLILHS